MKWLQYAILAVAGVALFLGAAYLPVSDYVSLAIASPGVLALVAALWQLMRDHWQHEREQLLKREEQAHALAASSHMAGLAFQRYGMCQ